MRHSPTPRFHLCMQGGHTQPKNYHLVTVSLAFCLHLASGARERFAVVHNSKRTTRELSGTRHIWCAAVAQKVERSRTDNGERVAGSIPLDSSSSS